MKINLRRLDSARFRRGRGILLTQTPPTNARKQPFRLLFPRIPIFPASGQGQWLFQEPPAKSKFLAFTALVTILAVMAIGCEKHSSAEPENADTLLNRGKSYADGEENKAFNCYRKAADQGNAEAQYLLGNCFFKGKGTHYDRAKAYEWYRKSAEQGHAEAQFILGSHYDGKDPIEAVKWFRKAADQGLASAQYALGLCYAEGKGVLKDFSEAAKWYNKAAEQGDADMQYRVGFNYQSDELNDPIEAEKWYSKATEHGNTEMQYRIGENYFNVKKFIEAVKWYRKAAEQGHAYAQYSLGYCYRWGKGVPLDLTIAYMWYNLAAANRVGSPGNMRDGAEWTTEVGKKRDEVAKEMTPEQIIEAQKFSREWKPVKNSNK